MNGKKIDNKKIEKIPFQELCNVISDTTCFPITIIDSEKIENLLNILKKDGTITKNFSEIVLRQEIGTFLSSLQTSPPKDKLSFQERVNNFCENLIKEKNYIAFIVIDGIYGVPIGTFINNLEIIEPDLTNPQFKEYIEKIQKEMTHPLMDCLWGKLQFKSYRIHDVKNVFYDKLELPLAILTFILNRRIDPNDIIGIIFPEKGKIHLIGGFKGTSWTTYDKNYEKSLKRLSEISIKANPSSIESKLLRSLDIFWLSQLTPKKEIEFLLLVSTLESLLLTSHDRDYLGMKLAEKSAFLLENNKNDRIQTYKSIKKMYDLRSNLVHKGERKIDENQLKQLKTFVYRIILKIIELSSIYDKMELKSNISEKDGIDDLLLELKFEGRSGS
jgi:hypothetical protein